MSETVYHVTGMTCGHCAAAVERELKKIAGVTEVDVDVETGAVKVESDALLERTEVAAAVEEAGYELIGN